MSPEELESIETTYDKYMQEGSTEKQGRDFCDMSKPYDTPREKYSVINAMLPRVYYPELQGNIYEQVGSSVAAQLFTGNVYTYNISSRVARSSYQCRNAGTLLLI